MARGDPVARAVIGGLLTSMLLTLLVVPVVALYLDDAVAWAKRVRSAIVTRVAMRGSVPATPPLP